MQENLLNRFYPSNLRAAYGSYIGADAPYAQWDFLPEDLQAMSQRFEKGRSNYVGGFVPRQTGFTNDWGHVSHDRFVPYEEYTQATHAVPSVQSLPSIGNVLQSYVDPNIRIDPFVQGGYYTQSPEGTYLRNTYVGPGGVQRDVNVLLPNRSQK